MSPSLRRTLVLAHLAALWPVGAWYVRRMTDGGAEPWGLVAAAAAIALALRAPPSPTTSPRLVLPTVLLALTVVAHATLPPLLAAAVGMTSLVALVSELRFGRGFDVGLGGLALLALPDISTLHYFVGWPMRIGVGHVVAWVLRGIGFDATPQGTLVLIGERAIAVDAPCSGVWMGWSAALAWLCLATARRLGPRDTLLGLAAVGPLVFVANVLRSTSLTMVELRAGLPDWVHDGVGLAVFALVAAALVVVSERLGTLHERRAACAPLTST